MLRVHAAVAAPSAGPRCVGLGNCDGKRLNLGFFTVFFYARREILDRGAVRRPSCGRVEPTGSAESGVSGEKSPNFSKMSLECLDGLQMAWESVWRVRREVGGRVGGKKKGFKSLAPVDVVRDVEL